MSRLGLTGLNGHGVTGARMREEHVDSYLPQPCPAGCPLSDPATILARHFPELLLVQPKLQTPHHVADLSQSSSLQPLEFNAGLGKVACANEVTQDLERQVQPREQEKEIEVGSWLRNSAVPE